MFKFNFSSDTSCQDSTGSDVGSEIKQWEDAEELDIDVPDKLLNTLSTRELSFNEIKVKLLRREEALTNIEMDHILPKNTVEAERNNSDLEPAKYEGGLKVWECCEDLANIIIIKKKKDTFIDKDILDLGCGSGLVGILALVLGAKSVTFQDYNQEVIKHWTSMNVSLNCQNPKLLDRCKFWCGDWRSFSDKCTNKFDYILTSETIYNPDNYEKLFAVMRNFMKPACTLYLAAKSVYFSLGGSVQLFLEELNKKSGESFAHRHVFKSDQGVQRVIVEIKHKCSS